MEPPFSPLPPDLSEDPASGPPAVTRAILGRIERDPEGGWGELLGHVESKLRLVLFFRMGERLRAAVDPDDLLQEVWLEAARQLDRFEYRGPGSLLRWMAGILRNKMLHAGRASGRMPLPASGLEASVPAPSVRSRVPDGLLEALSHSQPGVSWPARQAELRGRVRHALERLPAEQREAILMKLYEGLTGREAARLAGVDESTISVRFKKGLAACARHLRGDTP